MDIHWFERSAIGEELIEPTKIYSKIVHHLVSDFSIYGIAHITGGGIVENLPRILPSTCAAVIKEGSWEVPPVFTFLREAGNIPIDEMRKTFNNGIGMILVVSEAAAQAVMDFLGTMGEKVYIIGEIVKREPGAAQVRWA